MNRANWLLPLALLALLSVGACQKPDQPKPDPEQAISIPTQSQAVFNNGISFPTPSGQSQTQPQTQTVTFKATESWTTSITDTKSSAWLTVEPSSGGAGTINMTVTAQPNNTDKERNATVTIKSGSATKSFTVTQAAKSAEPIAVTAVELNKTELTLAKGASETLVATVKPDDATDKTVTWSTSDANIATVENGKVTAVKEGTATITAKAGEKTATCKVTVSKNVIAVTEITLNKTELALNEGASETLVATVKPDDATDKTVTWSTSDANIATVENGKVTAVKEGTATITAKAGEKTATCKVTVSKNVITVTEVTLNKTELSLKEGETETLTATVKPDDATDKTVTWSTSDASIATVENGKVTAVKEGTATITAKAGEKTATCKVTVSKNVITVTEVTLNKTELSLKEGETETLTATVKPDDATDKTVTWSTSDANIATVENGKVTAVKEGTATITAKAGDVSASCVVTVIGVSITVSPASLSFLASGGTKSIQITCNGDWSVSGTPDWCTLSMTSGSGNATIQLTAAKNNTAQQTAKITFTCLGKTADVKIKQTGGGWQNLRFVHKSLYMMFTSIHCGWSRYMNQNIRLADSKAGNKYCRVDVHGRGIGDVMEPSPIDFEDAKQLEGRYYSATPSGIIDYRVRLMNWSDENAHLVPETLISAIRQQEELYPAQTGVSFKSTLSGNSLTVNGTVYSHVAETFKLSVYLIEDGILDTSFGYSESYGYQYDNVLRKSLSNVLGDEFTIGTANSTHDFQYTITIPDDYKKENLSILVIVQRQYGAQAPVRDDYYGDYYVDNCRRESIGKEVKLEVYDFASGSGNEGIYVGDEITF